MSDNFTLKEMVSKVVKQNEDMIVQQAKTIEKLNSVNKHLEQLNSKVAAHADKINIIESKQDNSSAFIRGAVYVTSAIWGFAIAVYNIIK